MNRDMMNVIRSMHGANSDLVDALENAHNDLQGMLDQISKLRNADFTDKVRSDVRSEVPATEAPEDDSRTVTRADSQPEIPEDTNPYPADVTVSQINGFLTNLIDQLPENDAVLLDRKLRIRWLVKTLIDRYATATIGKVDAEEALKYEESQTVQYKDNWEALSKACRAFAANFNREGMNKGLQIQLDDMLERCEVESHNT